MANDPMSDEDFIGYCDIHCETERALFNGAQIRRMCQLAGHEPPRDLKDEEWFTMHGSMKELVRKAQQRLHPTPIDPLHPLGRCECNGEGRCAYCIQSTLREERDDARRKLAAADASLTKHANTMMKVCAERDKATGRLAAMRDKVDRAQHIIGRVRPSMMDEMFMPFIPAFQLLDEAMRESGPIAEALLELEYEVRSFIDRSAEITEKHPAYGFVVMGIPLAKVIAKLDAARSAK